MKIIVNDTNIFIDMHSIGLLGLMCELPHEIHTVDFVVSEIINPDQKAVFDQMIASGKIMVNSFTSTEVSEIFEEYSAVSGNLSITDCSVCYYARKNSVPMLTGDRRLRKYAEQQSIEVHGILFLFDEMVATGVLSPHKAAEKLSELMMLNARLPKTEITSRTDKWVLIMTREEITSKLNEHRSSTPSKWRPYAKWVCKMKFCHPL